MEPKSFDDWLQERARQGLGALARGGTTAEIELQLTESDGQRDYTVVLAGTGVSTRTGSSARPSVIVKLHGDDWRALVSGELDAAAGLVDGRLRVSGDLALATQLLPALLGPPAR